MAIIENEISEAFRCPKCNQRGAHVEKLSMSGTGVSRLFEVQPYRYVYASCNNCGFTEIYNLTTLEGKDDIRSDQEPMVIPDSEPGQGPSDEQ